MRYNDGFIIGANAARNIELGFVPSWVRLINRTTTTTIYEGPLAQVIAFDGGHTEIKAGARIDARDDGWRAIVKQVILQSGDWGSGNAAGFFVVEEGSLVGAANIADNDVIHVSDQVDLKGPTLTTVRANVNGAGLQAVGIRLAPEESTAGNRLLADANITAYFGSEAEGAKGFTISADTNADNDLLAYQAWAPDPGSSPVDMSRG